MIPVGAAVECWQGHLRVTTFAIWLHVAMGANPNCGFVRRDEKLTRVRPELWHTVVLSHDVHEEVRIAATVNPNDSAFQAFRLF